MKTLNKTQIIELQAEISIARHCFDTKALAVRINSLAAAYRNAVWRKDDGDAELLSRAIEHASHELAKRTGSKIDEKLQRLRANGHRVVVNVNGNRTLVLDDIDGELRDIGTQTIGGDESVELSEEQSYISTLLRNHGIDLMVSAGKLYAKSVFTTVHGNEQYSWTEWTNWNLRDARVFLGY